MKLTEFETRIGYHFKDRDLLLKALTHTSVGKKGSAFERLEFLGDRVLGLIVSHILYLHYPHEREGDLAKRLAHLVRRETCEQIALQLEADKIFKTAVHQSIQNTSMMADCCEALLGALFLDGGLEAAEKFIHTFWSSLISQDIRTLKDAKTRVQEWAQHKGMPLPTYTIIERQGPDHAPYFKVEIKVVGFSPMIGEGSTRRLSEQDAASKFVAAHAL